MPTWPRTIREGAAERRQPGQPQPGPDQGLQRRSGEDGEDALLPGHDGQRHAVHRPVRHGLGDHGRLLRIGQTRSASLVAVAPGIAEALIATAVGLFAAIPAVIAYNTFLHRIKDHITEMEDFSLELLSIAERLYGSP